MVVLRQLKPKKVEGLGGVNVKPEIVTLAKFEGHETILTSPYHSDLQAIELLWGLIKGNIVRSYSIGTTLQDVKEIL